MPQRWRPRSNSVSLASSPNAAALACATCHVFVDPQWIEATGMAEDFEDEMLDDAETPRQERSRLSCQLRMTEELDGLELTIAPDQ